MALLIDTSIFVTLERQGWEPSALADVAPDDSIAIACITASELLTGAHRANTPERRLRREAFVEIVLAAVPVLPFDLVVARTHAALWAEVAKAGQPIGAHDLIIAATALAHGYGVLTANVRGFVRVPGLTVVQPRWPES